MVIVEIIVDNDSCYSAKTVYSEPVISNLFSTLDSKTSEIINNANIDGENEKLIYFQFWGFSLLVLVLLKKVKKA